MREVKWLTISFSLLTLLKNIYTTEGRSACQGVFSVEICQNMEYYGIGIRCEEREEREESMDSFIIALISACGTIFSAFISAVALLKVNRIDNQDRIRRSLWAVEAYLLALGKYITNDSDTNFEEYRAYYLLCSLYSDYEIREKIQKIDTFIQQKNMKAALDEAVEFILQYSRKYKMNKYLPRKRWINFHTKIK